MELNTYVHQNVKNEPTKDITVHVVPSKHYS